MDRDNYITIQGWMRTELGLKNNELLVYAIIYGFSQTPEGKFTGTLQYLAEWCGASKQGILKNLTNLVDKGLLIKEEDSNKVSYRSTKFNSALNKVECSVKQSLTPVKQSLINNINNNIINKNKNNIISTDPDKKSFLGSAKKPKPKKSRYQVIVDKIIAFTDNEHLRTLLKEYVSLLSEMQVNLYSNQFTGYLNKLKELSGGDENKMRAIVDQSIQKGWKAFYPLSENINYELAVDNPEDEIVLSDKIF